MTKTTMTIVTKSFLLNQSSIIQNDACSLFHAFSLSIEHTVHIGEKMVFIVLVFHHTRDRRTYASRRDAGSFWDVYTNDETNIPADFRRKVIHLLNRTSNVVLEKYIGVRTNNHLLGRELNGRVGLYPFLEAAEPIFVARYLWDSFCDVIVNGETTKLWVDEFFEAQYKQDEIDSLFSWDVLQTHPFYMNVPRSQVDNALDAGFVFCEAHARSTTFKVNHADYYEHAWQEYMEQNIDPNTSLIFEPFWNASTQTYSMIRLPIQPDAQ